MQSCERGRGREKIRLSFEACTSASDPILDVVKDMCSLFVFSLRLRGSDQKQLQVVSDTVALQKYSVRIYYVYMNNIIYNR